MEGQRAPAQAPVTDVRWTTTSPGGTVRRYKNGLLHCEHGPAVTLPDGDVEWWLFGEQTLVVPRRSATGPYIARIDANEGL